VATAALAGCSAMTAQEQQLREAVVRTTQRQLEQLASAPRQLERRPSPLAFSPERLAELEAMSPDLLSAEGEIALPDDLLGKAAQTVGLTLEEAVQRAVRHNLDANLARIQPAIAASQIVQAQAVFDWTLFASFDFSKIKQQTPVPLIQGVPIGSALNKNQSFAFQTGLRRTFDTGGQLTISQGLDVFNNKSPGVQRFPDPTRTASLDITLQQPLLRNFGQQVNRAQIRLAHNAQRSAVEQLKTQLLRTAAAVEQAYWDLALAVEELKIRQRLLERGLRTQRVLEGRQGFDVRPAELSDAVARVEARKGDVIRARNRVLQASDRLKALLNDPELPLAQETALLPLDRPADAPTTFDLRSLVQTTLRKRPELQQAILAIDDAQIREEVARNARLPLLDVRFQTRFGGLGEDADRAYDELFSGDFVDYLVGVQFEQPLGNRLAVAAHKQRRLERLAAVTAHRNAVQQVLLEVKTALRDAATAYELIEQSRAARLAAAENLRTLLVEEENIRALTPDFLDLKLRRQEALAAAELQEAQARVDYSEALARLYAATGQALERWGVEVVEPRTTIEWADIETLAYDVLR